MVLPECDISMYLVYDFLLNSCPHITPKPGAPGKIYWCSGPPGAGKSTTCQLLARKNGYVYYEADATMQLINPFVPNDAENPSMAQIHQKSLKVRFVDSCLHSVWLIWDRL